jgi:hypothetical protein
MDVILIYLGVAALIACVLGYLDFVGGAVAAVFWPVALPLALLASVPIAAFGFGAWLRKKGRKA